MQWELNFLKSLQGMRTPFLDELMKGITFLGDKGWFWIAVAVVMLFFKKTREMGLAALVAMVIGLVLGNGVMKNVVGRARPSWIDETVKLIIENPHDFSFPSGHTQASFAAAVAFWAYMKKWGGAWTLAGVASVVLAALIAFSRMYLFVHFPTDILAGLALGILFAYISCPIAHWLLRKAKKMMKQKTRGKSGKSSAKGV